MEKMWKMGDDVDFLQIISLQRDNSSKTLWRKIDERYCMLQTSSIYKVQCDS